MYVNVHNLLVWIMELNYWTGFLFHKPLDMINQPPNQMIYEYCV